MQNYVLVRFLLSVSFLFFPILLCWEADTFCAMIIYIYVIFMIVRVPFVHKKIFFLPQNCMAIKLI